MTTSFERRPLLTTCLCLQARQSEREAHLARKFFDQPSPPNPIQLRGIEQLLLPVDSFRNLGWMHIYGAS